MSFCNFCRTKEIGVRCVPFLRKCNLERCFPFIVCKNNHSAKNCALLVVFSLSPYIFEQPLAEISCKANGHIVLASYRLQFALLNPPASREEKVRWIVKIYKALISYRSICVCKYESPHVQPINAMLGLHISLFISEYCFQYYYLY